MYKWGLRLTGKPQTDSFVFTEELSNSSHQLQTAQTACALWDGSYTDFGIALLQATKTSWEAT